LLSWGRVIAGFRGDPENSATDAYRAKYQKFSIERLFDPGRPPPSLTEDDDEEDGEMKRKAIPVDSGVREKKFHLGLDSLSQMNVHVNVHSPSAFTS
jgi:hypothetical protein